MKHIKLVLPYILAIIIIFAGYFSIDGIKTLLPSHKEIVRVFEKPEQNNLFYMEKNDQLTVYPWDDFDESKCVLLSEYFGEQNEEYVEIMKNEMLKNLILAFENNFLSPDQQWNFYPEILYDEKLSIGFVKDYVYKNTEGEEISVSYAFTNDNVLYLHCEEYNQKDLTTDEIQNANLKINDYARTFNSETESDVFYDIALQSNPFFTFAVRSTGLYVPVDVRTLLSKNTPTVTPHKGELLLIYYSENRQVVLYYNPRIDSITGFSVK